MRATVHRSSGSDQYRIAPAPTLNFAARVVTALAELEGSGATLALLPRATLDDATLARWVAAMRNGAGPGMLKWVLVGNCAVDAAPTGSRAMYTGAPFVAAFPQARNRAVLLKRDTRAVLLVQNKRVCCTNW